MTKPKTAKTTQITSKATINPIMPKIYRHSGGNSNSC